MRWVGVRWLYDVVPYRKKYSVLRAPGSTVPVSVALVGAMAVAGVVCATGPGAASAPAGASRARQTARAVSAEHVRTRGCVRTFRNIDRIGTGLEGTPGSRGPGVTASRARYLWPARTRTVCFVWRSKT